MTIRATQFLIGAVFLFFSPLWGQAPIQKNPVTPVGNQEKPHPAKALLLDDLERMALQNNPTLKQAEANIRAAQGRLEQAGLYPNPTIGYSAAEVSSGPIIRGGEHGFFVGQTIVLGGKLRKSHDVSAQALTQSEAEAEAQRIRVLNFVRALYYEALGAERLVDIRKSLAQVAEDAVKTSQGLFNVGASDKPDLLEVEIEERQARLAVAMAENGQIMIWQHLSALVGVPDLEPTPLAGDLAQSVPSLERTSTLLEILQGSPELKAARAGAQRAEKAVALARSQRIPDLQARGGLHYNRELLEIDRRAVGLEGFAEIGIQIPLFNRNQGNIRAAASEAESAQQEIRRTEMSIRARFSALFERYQTSRRLVEDYKNEIIPRAEQAHELYLARFKEMAAAYPQVLIARRTFFQAQVGYITAVTNLWKAAVPLRGYLLMDGFDAPRSFSEIAGSLQSIGDRLGGKP